MSPIFLRSLLGQGASPSAPRMLLRNDERLKRFEIHIPIFSDLPSGDFFLLAQPRDVITSKTGLQSGVACCDQPNSIKEYFITHDSVRMHDLSIILLDILDIVWIS